MESYYVLAFIFLLVCLCWACYDRKKKNDIVEKENFKIFNENQKLKNEYNELLNSLDELYNQQSQVNKEYTELKTQKRVVEENIKIENNHYEELKHNVEKYYESQKEMAEKAFNNFCDSLDNDYKQKENEYKELTELLGKAYTNQQSRLNAEADIVRADLEKMRASRAAAIQAQIREKEIEENSSFYCLEISDIDKSDIEKLNMVKKTLHNPRILSMLIWQTYFQKPLKSKSAEILGTSTVTGIYKITNIITKQCYIGQAKDIATRWSEHTKCGLGIDTPTNNKLYRAMQEDGIYNFSFELLEACPPDQLDEKEKYYIDLYDSCNYGYNSTSGNGKYKIINIKEK